MAREMAITVKLLKLVGMQLLVPLTGAAARKCGFKAGSFVRVIVLDNEIRIRPATVPRLYDGETEEERQERMMKDQAMADLIREEHDED